MSDYWSKEEGVKAGSGIKNVVVLWFKRRQPSYLILWGLPKIPPEQTLHI